MAMVATAIRETETSSSQNERKSGFVCPPCGCGSDDEVHAESGSCEACGMSLIRKMAYMTPVERIPNPNNQRINVVILIFEGVQIIDYTGPYEVFGQAGFQVTTVAPSKEVLRTNMGMNVVAHHDFEDSPTPDIFVIPGGGVNSITESEEAVAWVKKTAEAGKHVLTVCNGAFILAQTGLLDGYSATTYYGLIDSLRDTAPNVNVVTDQRYVDNGKYITTAGLSSGLDGSLYLISKLRSRARAQSVALNMEYDWKEDANYARAAFADRMLVNTMISPGFMPLMEAPDTRWKVLSTSGNADRWQIEWHVTGAANPQTIQEFWRTKITTDTDWEPAGKAKRDGKTSHWRSPKTRDGQWEGVITVVPGPNDLQKVTLIVERKPNS
jgi:putative intracellular protease/amidase